MTYVPKHLHLWTRPDCYMGPNWNDYYVVLVQNRDSDALDRSNWRCALADLQEAEGNMGDEMLDKDGDSFLQVVRDSHWAVGWVEFLYLHKDAPESILREADAIRARLKDYLVLNEDDWSDLEYEEAADYWARMSVRERVEMIRDSRCGASIFAARRAELPQDDNGSLMEHLR